MLCAAITATYCGERMLFEKRAHERSVVFHIARHLASQAEALSLGWSVDVEYDPWHRSTEVVKKRLYLHRVRRARETALARQLTITCTDGLKIGGSLVADPVVGPHRTQPDLSARDDLPAHLRLSVLD